MFVGIDFGTSRIKGCLLSSEGAIIRHLSSPYSHSDTSSGVAQWLDELRRMVRELVVNTAAEGRTQALAVTGMAPNVCVMNRDQEVRTILFHSDLAYQREIELDRRLDSPKWSNEVVSKLSILAESFSERPLRWFTTHTLLGWYLSGEYYLDSAVLSETGTLLEVMASGHSEPWLSALTEYYEWPRTVAPCISVGIVTDTEVADMLGRSCTLCAGSSDSIATILGSGAMGITDFLIYFGTFNSATRIHRSVTDILEDQAPVGALDWFCSLPRSGHQLDLLVRLFVGPGRSLDYDTLLKQAAKEPPGCRGVKFVHTAFGVNSTVSTYPFGTVFDLPLDASSGLIVRSFLESFGYALRLFGESEKVDMKYLTAYIAGGGARSSVWPQIVSDIIQVPLIHCEGVEDGLGSAFLAAASVLGTAAMLELRTSFVQSAHVYHPNSSLATDYAQACDDYRRVFGWGKKLLGQ